MFQRFRKTLPDHIGLGHWLKVLVIFVFIIALTWYGKFHKGKPEPARVHGTLAWVVPTQHGLSTLLVLSDDGVDTNNVRTGLRIWVNPPKTPLLLEEQNHALFRGKSMVAIGDSLAPETIRQLGSMIDTGGFLLVIGHQAWLEDQMHPLVSHIRFRQSNPHREPWGWLGDLAGEGFTAELRFGISQDKHPPAYDHQLTVAWEGYRIRVWGTWDAARADDLKDSLSVGILSACSDAWQTIPHLTDTVAAKVMFYCGQQKSPNSDTRIPLQEPNAGAIFYEDLTTHRMLVKHVHLNWNPAEE